jgi:hypothetical protein
MRFIIVFLVIALLVVVVSISSASEIPCTTTGNGIDRAILPGENSYDILTGC